MSKKSKSVKRVKKTTEALRLDFGCGKNVREGFVGVDQRDFGQKHVVDLRKAPWPWADNSVDEAHASHFLEHLEQDERVTFFNELHRVLKPGAQALVVTPDWTNACAYGDPTHRWPPTSSWYVLYLSKQWRDAQAPHTDYTCDFDYVIAGSWEEWANTRTVDVRTWAMQHYTNTMRDLIVTVTKRSTP